RRSRPSQAQILRQSVLRGVWTSSAGLFRTCPGIAICTAEAKSACSGDPPPEKLLAARLIRMAARPSSASATTTAPRVGSGRRQRGRACSQYALSAESLELPDKPDLRLQAHRKLVLHGILRMRNQSPHVSRCRMAEVNHDVRVNMRNLCVANPVALQPALVDQTSRAHPFDLLEDRACAGVNIQPGVARTAPAQVLLKYPVHHRRVAALQTKVCAQHVVVLVVKHGIVIAELHVVRVYHSDLTFIVENAAILEHLGNEHRPFPLRRRRQEVQVLPDCPAYRARNADVMLQARPAAIDRF